MDFVTGLLGPLLTDAQVHWVKGCDQAQDGGSGTPPTVVAAAELLARPLLGTAARPRP